MYFAGFAAGSAVFGPVCDRIGRKRSTAICLIGTLLCFAVSAGAGSFAAYAAARFAELVASPTTAERGEQVSVADASTTGKITTPEEAILALQSATDWDEQMAAMQDSMLNNASDDFTEISVFRSGYSNWRRGGVSGAKGSIVSLRHEFSM